jgi:hypothetical protein
MIRLIWNRQELVKKIRGYANVASGKRPRNGNQHNHITRPVFLRNWRLQLHALESTCPTASKQRVSKLVAHLFRVAME